MQLVFFYLFILDIKLPIVSNSPDQHNDSVCVVNNSLLSNSTDNDVDNQPVTSSRMDTDDRLDLFQTLTSSHSDEDEISDDMAYKSFCQSINNDLNCDAGKSEMSESNIPTNNHDTDQKSIVHRHAKQGVPAGSNRNGTTPSVTPSSGHSSIKRKPGLSYIALISKAIQSSSEQRMLLSEIYDWITQTFAYFKKEDRSWRNSVRHNLSLNECFVKSGRSETGKGSYWTIHPACDEDFMRGDYRRRHARIRARKDDQFNTSLDSEYSCAYARTYSHNASSQGYVPMTSTLLSTNELVSLFGADVVMTTDEQLLWRQRNQHFRILENDTFGVSTRNNQNFSSQRKYSDCLYSSY